jgi:hypothetical protein
MKHSVLTVVCLASLTLAACDRSMASNTKICADFKAAKAASTFATDDGAGPLDECVKRWAYSLASSGDSADTVGNAAVAACSTQLARWNQQTLSAPGGVGEGPSLLTGEITTPLGEHNNLAQSRALFYVVQARAGNCAPPAAKNGVPEGTS